MGGTTPRAAALLACLAMLLAGLALVAGSPGRAGPEELPDLSVSPADILFMDPGGLPVNETTPGQLLFINLTVRNRGQAASGPFDVSFFENGALLEKVRYRGSVGPGNATVVSLDWDTVYSFVGLCGISVSVYCPAGDATPADNTAGRTIRLHPVAPEMTLALEPREKEFEPAHEGFSGLSLRGTVELRMPFNQTALVLLRAETDLGWCCTVQPAFIRFWGPGPDSFWVFIAAPDGAEGGRPSNVTVNATALSGGFEVFAINSSKLTPARKFGVSIACDRPYLEIPPGGTARYTLKITNTGNFQTDLVLGIANLGDLGRKGWTVGLSRPNLTGVAPGETRLLNITARSPGDETVWKSEPTVFILNVSAPALNSTRIYMTYPFYAYEKGASFWGNVACWALGIGTAVLVAYAVFDLERTLRRKGLNPPGPA